MASTRTLEVRVIGDERGLGRAFANANRDAGRFGKSMSGTLRGISRAAAGASLALGGALAGGIAIGIRGLVDHEKVTAQTAATLKSTGGAAKVTAGDIEGLADAIERKTGVDGDQVQSAENLLLTFTNIRDEVGRGNDVFTQATRAATDMSVALGQDSKASAIQLGKALNDPIKGVTALQKVGVSFTTQQKDQIRTLVESGRTLDAQKVILAELNREFGGSAEAFGQTTAGKVERLKRSFEAVTEELAAAVLPALTRAGEWLVSEGIPRFQAFARGVSRAFSAIAGFAREHWPQVQAAIRVVVDYIRDNVVPAVQTVVTVFRAAWGKLAPLVRTYLQAVLRVAEPVFKTIAAAVNTFLAVLRGDWGAAWNGLRGVVKGVLVSIPKAIIGSIGSVAAAAVRLGAEIADAIISGIGDLGSRIAKIVSDAISGALKKIGLQGTASPASRAGAAASGLGIPGLRKSKARPRVVDQLGASRGLAAAGPRGDADAAFRGEQAARAAGDTNPDLIALKGEKAAVDYQIAQNQKDQADVARRLKNIRARITTLQGQKRKLEADRRTIPAVDKRGRNILTAKIRAVQKDIDKARGEELALINEGADLIAEANQLGAQAATLEGEISRTPTATKSDGPTANDVAAAVASTTPGLEDDVAAAQGQVSDAQAAFDAAVASGDPGKIIEAAGRLTSSKSNLQAFIDALNANTKALNGNTDATDQNTTATDQAAQSFAGTVGFSFRGQSYVVGQSSDSINNIALGV